MHSMDFDHGVGKTEMLSRISTQKSQTQRCEARDFVCTSQNIQFLRSNTIFINHFLSYFSPNYIENLKEYIWIFPPPDEPATRKRHKEYKEVRIPAQSRGCIATGYLPFPQFLPSERNNNYEDTYLCSYASSTCNKFTSKKIGLYGQQTQKNRQKVRWQCWQITRVPNWQWQITF